MGMKSSHVSALWSLMAMVDCMQHDDSLAFMMLALGCAMTPARGHAATFHKTVAWVLSGQRTTQLCRPRGSPSCPPRAGRLTGWSYGTAAEGHALSPAMFPPEVRLVRRRVGVRLRSSVDDTDADTAPLSDEEVTGASSDGVMAMQLELNGGALGG